MSFFVYHNQTFIFHKSKFCNPFDLFKLFDLYFIPNEGLYIPFYTQIGTLTYIPDLLHYHQYLLARKNDPNITYSCSNINLDLLENISATDEDTCIHIDLNLNIHDIRYLQHEFKIYKQSNKNCTYYHILEKKYTDEFATCVDIAIEEYNKNLGKTPLHYILGPLLIDNYILQSSDNLVEFHLKDVVEFFNSRRCSLDISSINK